MGMDQKENLVPISYYLHCLENKQKGLLRFLESLLQLIKIAAAGVGKLLFKGKALT